MAILFKNPPEQAVSKKDEFAQRQQDADKLLKEAINFLRHAALEANFLDPEGFEKGYSNFQEGLDMLIKASNKAPLKSKGYAKIMRFRKELFTVTRGHLEPSVEREVSTKDLEALKELNHYRSFYGSDYAEGIRIRHRPEKLESTQEFDPF